MITPRTTRLVRVRRSRDLATVLGQLWLGGPLLHADPLAARDTLVVLPTRAAGLHLRRAMEARTVGAGDALILPDMVTRAGLVEALARRLPDAPPSLTAVERAVLMGAACRASVARGVAPPFRLRAGLVSSMVEFYDGLRRLGQSVDAFERLTAGSLEPESAIDRGAERLLRQTRFLADAFRGFERAVGDTGRLDEHGLREAVRTRPADRPWRHVVVACRDAFASALGLWPADFDLLTRVPGLERLDVVVTEAALAGELHERLRRWLPEADEVTADDVVAADATAGAGASGPDAGPVLLVRARPAGDDASPGGGLAPRVHLSRDREEEVRDFARRIKVQARDAAPVPLEATALVVRRPLPYVYLTGEVLATAGVPCQRSDALPLAAEPFAAALDLVASGVAAAWSRATLVALLASPLFEFEASPGRRTLSAFDRALHEAGFLGGAEAMGQLVTRWAADPAQARLAAAGRLACAVLDELAPLGADRPAAEHVRVLRTFLTAHGRSRVPSEAALRFARARAAVLNGLIEMEAAFAAHDPTPVAFADVDAVIKGWVEAHTFAPRAGEAGVHLADAESAVFGAFDDVQIAGLVDGEWPARPAAGIFYPTGLLRDLGWPGDRDRVAGERALLADLVALPRLRLVASAFHLEDDALVPLSPLVDLLDALPAAPAPDVTGLRVGLDEALMGAVPAVADGDEARQAWLALRLDRPAPESLAPTVTMRPYSVSALERYQDCPFRFFASEVLRIDEPPEDQSALTPRARGTLIHAVLQRFFDEWDRSGRALTPSAVVEARRHLGAVVDEALAALPASDAALERARFFGSPVAPGFIDVLLRLEASRAEPARSRWLERRMEGRFSLGSPDRQVELRGVVDRVDLLDGRRLRVIDYKSGAVPQPRRALQAPIYALFAAERLAEADGGEPWTIDEASYVAFSGKRTVAPVIKPGAKDTAAVLADVRERTFEMLDRITAGAFPVKPHDIMTCRFCSYAPVCRKDYVGDE
ncbi:MAG: PD-(D/E)XK nuclease family protein [Vicinamibacterales bacterium]